MRENYADVMQAQLSDWIQMILVQGSKELDNGASADLYKNEGAIYLYGNIMKYVEEWAAEAQKAVVYTNAFAGAIYQFEGKVDGRNHGYQGVLLDIGMTSRCDSNLWASGSRQAESGLVELCVLL